MGRCNWCWRLVYTFNNLVIGVAETSSSDFDEDIVVADLRNWYLGDLVLLVVLYAFLSFARAFAASKSCVTRTLTSLAAFIVFGRGGTMIATKDDFDFCVFIHDFRVLDSFYS
jgi:hypothetical protein